MQPSGLLSATGVAVASPFLRPFLDKWKIRPIVVKREEFKNAANFITESGYTPAHRSATQEIIQGFSSQIVSGIATDRCLLKTEVPRSPWTQSLMT